MTELVGILNITPDSIDGGHEPGEDAIAHAEKLHADGASLIDVGGESSRPGATPLTGEEEFVRLVDFLEHVERGVDFKLSIDTYHPYTVIRTSEIIGTNFILNDITGLRDPRMRGLAAKLGLTVVTSHHPRTSDGAIQSSHSEPKIDSLDQVVSEMTEQIDWLIDEGLKPDRIIVDPGIGFGKTADLNQRLLSFAFEFPDFDVMIGYSQKRFLGERRKEIEPNLAAGRIAVESGAKYLRVHDVAGHKPLIDC